MRPRIVIVGAGFGGIAAARALKRAEADILLIGQAGNVVTLGDTARPDQTYPYCHGGYSLSEFDGLNIGPFHSGPRVAPAHALPDARLQPQRQYPRYPNLVLDLAMIEPGSR